jgi:predicted lipoprotein with Yx(FWY)xxD motif
MRSRLLMVATLLIVGLVVFACSTPGASVAPSATAAAPSVAASEEPPAASEEPTEEPSEEPPAAAEATVEVGTFRDGEFIVAGSNQMTVYIFTKDVKDSGKSACSGGCLETWPALTVPAGTTPSAGTGVTGTLGTITREDDGTLQVTYNGLPLYFFKNDAAVGDLNGVYENWEAVAP